MAVSIRGYSRVLWVILDGMGSEHVKLVVDSGSYQAFSRINREGCFVPMRPASPVCQTPPALLALFSGTQPSENGVWGYYMPHPERLDRSMSGFFADVRRTKTLWQELEERGAGYSLMNVAFRNDPVWQGPAEHLAFGYDGYRLWRKPSLYRLSDGRQQIAFCGIALSVRCSPRAVTIAKGASPPTVVSVGEVCYLAPTPATSLYAHLLEPRLLLLNPVTGVVCRGAAAPSADARGFFDMSTFHLVRRLNASRDGKTSISAEAELLASRVSFQSKADLMLSQARNRAARLVVGYFPVIDEFNHAYFDLFLGDNERAHALFQACAGMVDGLLSSLMQDMHDDEMLVVSSDHGAMAFRSVLHLNEVLADAGLVRRRPGGYDYPRSLAWYHTSDCGQVVSAQTTGREALLTRVKQALDAAREGLGADIGVLDGNRDSPFLAFLYPKGDVYFTGRAPRRGAGVLDGAKVGGHHLSPLSPDPWIQAALGLWSPRKGDLKGGLPFIPQDNIEMKRFLMEALELA